MKLSSKRKEAVPKLSDKVRVVINGFSKDNGSRPVTSRTITLVQTSMKEVSRLLLANCSQED